MLTPYHQQNPTPNAASDLPLETVFSRQAENVVIFSWVFGPRLYIVLNNKTLKRADTHTHARARAHTRARTHTRTHTHREREIYIYIYLFNII